MRTASMTAAVVAIAVLAGCATGPRTPPLDCLTYDVPFDRTPLTVIDPTDLSVDVALLEALADEPYGPPAEGLSEAWLRISDSEMRLCRWGYHRCLGSLYGTYYDFDLSGAEPVLTQVAGGACVIA